MSRLCAKPTCSSAATRWFEVDGADRRVAEKSQPTITAIALCESHGERFSAPKGWTWVPLERPMVEPAGGLMLPASSGEALIDELSRPSTTSRRHTRDAPWFLAGAAEMSDPSTTNAGASPPETTNDTPAQEPSVGSLLHRAFHGPDRAADAARARSAERDTASTSPDDTDTRTDAVATVRDIRSRRAPQPSVTGYDVELPFPPADSSPHVAVS